MTRATLTLGPKEAPNGKVEVEVLYLLPTPPHNRYIVRGLNDNKQYEVSLSQLTNIITVES